MNVFLKKHPWLIKLPIVLFFSSVFLMSEGINSGKITNLSVHQLFYKPTQWVSGRFTDLKFFLRGSEKPKDSRIVIVDIDNFSIDKVNEARKERWPWHRDLTAALIERVLAYGAKAVALDIVFSEEDPRVPIQLKEELTKAGVEIVYEDFETDYFLANLVKEKSDQIVTGWMSPGRCQPLLDGRKDCAVTDPAAIADVTKDFRKLKIMDTNIETGFDPNNTMIFSTPVVVSNFKRLEKYSLFGGNFDVIPDVDGIVRRAQMVSMVAGEPHSTLSLALAQLAFSEQDYLSINISKNGEVRDLSLAKNKISIPVNRNGEMEINFRGGKGSFPYLSAFHLLADVFGFEENTNVKRDLASMDQGDPKTLLKDALVFVGVSATGAYDMRSFPFAADVPGVEGHATILDNILAKDWLIPAYKSLNGWGTWIVFFLMTVLALAAAYWAQVMNALPALTLFIGSFLLCGFLDVFVLFKQLHMNWNTSFLYIEMATIFGLSIAIKYFNEEQNKKFLKSAFSKYVSPDIVDSILKDPTSLNLGGERRELTILFSDIRSFTTFSEQMEAKQLSAFLNDYLGIMTNIVFKYKGTLDKYIGDAVMAFWGAPVADPSHGQNAVLAAQEMMKALHENRPRWMKTYFKGIKDVKIDIGIGINTGPVSVGNMGCENNFEYTVIGDNVNLASRLEGLTKSYHAHILTSRATFNDVLKTGGVLPPHRTLDSVKVKGKKQAVELIEIFDNQAPVEAIEEFHRARALYATQSWQLARESFMKAHELMKSAGVADDEMCREYIERCNDFEKNPPGADWDGSWTMTSK